MGFWDFIAPDYEDFLEVATDVLPAGIAIGPVVLSQEEIATAAWASPGSGAGLALRLYYAATGLGVPRTQLDGLWSAVADQATSPGFGAGPGVGGSFGWEAIKIMPTLIIPDAFRVAIEQTSGGRPVVNVVGVVNSGGTALGAAQAVQAAWKVATGPLSRLASTVALTGFRATDLSSAQGQVALLADASPGTNGNVGKSTNGACALVKMGGGTRSRSSSGRLYFGPIGEQDIQADGRSLEVAARTGFQTAFEAFRSSLNASGYVLSVLSPTLSIATPVASLAVESIIATQRRRIRG